MMLPAAVSDEEVNAYIDGALDPADAAAVAVHLATHPGAAARAEAFRAQTSALHALFDHMLDQKPPARLSALMHREDKERPGSAN